MLKVWKWYQNCLAVHPVKTQVISSGVIWGFGDIAAQTITNYTAKKHHQIQDEDKELKINWKRVATTSLFGFGFVGPVGHFWYEGLDRFIRFRLLLRPNSFRFVATKVAVDGFLFGPLDLLVFFTYMGFSTGKSVPQIKEDVKRDFLPALILEGGIWPIVQVANFRYIPVRYQLLYVNFFCLLDSCFLSWIEQQQDAPWKQWLKSYLPLKEQKGQDIAYHASKIGFKCNHILQMFSRPEQQIKELSKRPLETSITHQKFPSIPWLSSAFLWLQVICWNSLLELDGLTPYSLVLSLYLLKPYS